MTRYTDHLNAEIDRLEKEIDRLQAIVALLPTNADGAVMFRGSVVYWWEDEKVQRGIFLEIGPSGAHVEQQPEGDSCWPLIEWLYSTPEAAEASA